MIRSWLNKRRRGAMAMVAVVGMMPVTSMFAANINTSQIIEDRRHVQDAADALAKTHGVWTARALNVISMNNVTTAQLLTVAVGSDALDATLVELIINAGLQEAEILAHGLRECAPRFKFLPADLGWAAICVPQHAAVALPAVNAQLKADEIYRRFDPLHGSRVATKALAAIEGMNRALIARHPRAMREIGADYAKFLGIDDYHFADPCGSPLARNCQRTNSRDGMALPLEPGGMIENMEMCAAMRRGNTGLQTTFDARGFKTFQGPISYGGSAQNRNVKDHINEVTKIGLTLQDYDRFYRSGLAHMIRHPLSGPRFTPAGNIQTIPRGRYTLPLFPLYALQVTRMVPLLFFDRNVAQGAFLDRQTRNGHNAFKRWFEIKFGAVCGGFADVPIIGLAAKVPTLWKLTGVSIVDRALNRTPDQMDEAFHILAFALKKPAKPRDMVIPYLTAQVTPGDIADQTAYGQVGVFNPDGATLYAQSWRARLMAATRMDDVSDAASNLNRESTASFDDLANMLGGVSDQSTWGRVHAH